MTLPSCALVTGASGFLGGHIVRRLREEGVTVIPVPGRRDMSRLDALAAGAVPDVVIHAGFHVDFSFAEPEAAESENVTATRALAVWAAARGVPWILFLSAAATLGVSAEGRVRCEDDLGATDPPFASFRDTCYVRDKLACEELLVACFSGRVTVLYLTTVYGRGMPVETRAALGKLRGLSPVVLVPPGGTSFLALEDFLEGLRRVLERGVAGRFVLSGGNARYRDLYVAAAHVLGTRRRKWIVPLARSSGRLAGRFAGRFLKAAVLESAFGYKYYSAERARRTFGFSPRRGLRETLEAGLLDD